MARFLDVAEDDWDKLIDDKLREIEEEQDGYVPDSLPTKTDKEKIKYSIKTNKKEVD